MSWPRWAVAAARAVNAIFFFAIATYGVLAYSPFAYEVFIKPDVLPAISVFISLSPAFYWIAFLTSLLTLLPYLWHPPRSRAAIAYAIVWSAVGVWISRHQEWAQLGSTPGSLIVGLLALANPVTLAFVDCAVLPAPALVPPNVGRVVRSMLGAGVLAWLIYTAGAPLRARSAVGIHLTVAELVLAITMSGVAVVSTFAAASLAVAAVLAIAGRVRARSMTTYGALVTLLAISVAIVVWRLVFVSIALRGPLAGFAACAIAAAVTTIWVGCGRIITSGASVDSFTLFTSPIAGATRLRGRTAAASIVALTIAAFVLVDAVGPFDWNFLIQKLVVLVVWLAAVAVMHAWTADGPAGNGFAVALAPLAVIAACVTISIGVAHLPLVPGVSAESVYDRYTALDPSYRLIRDARTVPSGDTAKFYAYLRANTLVQSGAVHPPAIDFVAPLRAAPDPKPMIFLFIIDSLRRDYLSPYNPAVTFTPAIGKLAADSVVFDRAFTRYAGTGLAVPSIWAGGMLIHNLELRDFGSRNTLLKLLDANNYHLAVSPDSVLTTLMPPRPDVTELDRGAGTMRMDFCRTLGEVQSVLATGGDARPLFVYTLPQNVHIAVAARHAVAADEHYPGFFAPVAASVREVDACLGRFVDYLVESGLYDRSVIILTADHGDSLGEGGRWGHAYFMYPEVMRVPLIVHLPSWLKTRESADRTALAMSTDIAPTLYELLGYTPADLGPLFGRPLFGRGAAPKPRSGAFLTASSYGAVYGTLSDNGQEMYTADAVDAREFAFDLHGDGPGERLALTANIMSAHRQVIRDQLTELATLNHFVPQ